MQSCRFLCLLLFPLLAVNATEDLEEEYSTQGKAASSRGFPDALSLPAEVVRGDRLEIPKLWDVLYQRLSGENEARLNGQAEAVSKRVFCNGFTGCGGRFRGRRRQHSPPLGKRPFCNIVGCGNLGKRAEVPQKAAPVDKLRLPEALRNKLFCNSAYGCRGLKRALYSNWLSKLNGIADDL